MSSAFAFEGELTYEVQEGEFSKSTNAAKIKIYLVDSRLRVDYISSIDTELTSIYLNYKLGTGYFVQNKNKELIDLRTVFKAADFLMPEELTKNDSSKMLLENKTEEYESFYFINKTRLPIKAWYSSQTFTGVYFPVWDLFKFRPDMIIANYFINMNNRQIAYEINFSTLEGKKMSYKLRKIDRKKLLDSSFELP